MSAASRRGGPRRPPAPRWLLPLAVVALLHLLLPLVSLAVGVPWGRLPLVLASEPAREALALSLGTCLAALGLDLLLGLPLAVLLARPWWGVRLLRVLVALPLSVPPVVAGLALLMLYGRRGPVGSLLDAAGVTLAFTPVAVVMAQVFVSLPFLVLTVESALRARPSGLEGMAASLGASPTRVLTRITLPLVAPAVARGAALALARCLGEFGATLTFAGSLRGVTRTMPLEVHLARESDPDLALVLGLVLLAVALVVVALTEMRPPGWMRPGRAGLTAEGPVTPSTAEVPPLREAPSGRGGAPVRGVVPTTPTRPPGTGSSDLAPAAPRPLALRVAGEVRERDWRVALDIEAGVTLAVMGHNGAGKSTLAQVLVGSLALDEGEVVIGGRSVDSPAGVVPSAGRPVALLGQDPLLFPHMSVLDNVAFPLRCRGTGSGRARELAGRELASIGCTHLAARRGDELSGGEAARVALARALVARPGVLVLDEPTAALDVETAAGVLALLAARLRGGGVTTVLITHEVTVALALADELAVLESGRLVERGVPAEVLAAPVSRFGARLAGLNVVPGRVRSEGEGLLSVPMGSGRLVALVPSDGCAEGDEVGLLFPPEAVTLHACPPRAASPRSVVEGVVRGVRDEGGVVLVEVEVGGGGPLLRARVTTVAWASIGGGVGGRVWCAVKATQVRVVVCRRGL